ncbi:MAG TPA: HTTM domain-containing protein [Fimbriimonadaceae bacterium]|nr:HTTM domain-containing protein [Fimbriimonadaceae bacterium]
MAKRKPSAFRGWLKSLDNYWFGWNSPTTMGLFRIIMSSLIFVNLCMILTDFGAWFSEKGFVPEHIGKTYMPNPQLAGNFLGLPFHFTLPIIGDQIPRINLLSGVTNDTVTLAFYLILMAATLLCAFGLWTRVTSIMMAVGIVTLHHRNGLILHGGDSVIRVSSLYIALAPSGAACSLDRVIGLWKGRIKPGPVRLSVWVQRVLAYNVALIYFTTFWHKYGFGSHWRDMTATWYPARLHEFDRFPVPGFVNQLPFVYFTTFMTLVIELGLGTLVFYRPLRKWFLLGGLGLHAYIEYSMNIPLFSYLMVTLYLAFYDGTEIDAWAKRLGQRFAKAKSKIMLPNHMRLKPAHAAALDAMDPLELIEYDPGDSPSWETTAGKNANPFRVSLVRSIGAWPLGVVPTLWKRLLTSSLESIPTTTQTQETAQRAKIRR